MPKTDVDYSDRPNKSLVRSRIFYIIEETFHPKHKHSERLSFITFSGFRFIDSIEFYKRFNIRNVYSIERDPRLCKRAKFNRPYDFIDVTEGEIKDFIDEKYNLVVETSKVVYLDYESRFQDNIISDLDALFSSGFFDKDSLLFIAFNRGFDRAKLTSVVKEIIPEDIQTPEAFRTWLSKEFSYVVLNRLCRKYGRRKRLEEVLKVFYRDTANMVVFGYLIVHNGEGRPFKTVKPEIFALPQLTFLEANYIRNNLKGKPSTIAHYLGLRQDDVEIYVKYS